MTGRRWVILAATWALAGFSARSANANCADMAGPFPAQPAGQKRPVTQTDIIELRDIGDPSSPMFGFASRLAVSPDGTRVAFGMIRADVATNAYCQAVYVLDLRTGAQPQPVDSGGSPRLNSAPFRGFIATQGGLKPTIPLWSPDGQSLAFLRADRGVTQAWVAPVDGSGGRAVTSTRGDVTAIAWSSDGGSLLFATSQSAAAEDAAIDREAQTGWHYDARFFTSYLLRPLVSEKQSYDIAAVTLATGASRAATAAEVARVGSPLPWLNQDPPEARAADGRRAWGERAAGGRHMAVGLVTSDAGGRRSLCAADWCRTGIYRLWWDPAGPGLYVQRREGRAKEVAAFYYWVPGHATARRFFASTDVVNDCEWAAAGFVCTRENATTPRHLVLIDRRSGRSTALFNPNPGFAAIELGSVRRLHVKNALGLESWGDLVLPIGYRRGEKLPLVLVQYKSHGFLRGGIGDEYPIYPLVQRGFAVLSVERPPFVSSTGTGVPTGTDPNTTNFRGWSDRQSVLASIELLLDQAIGTGTIDPEKIGITGLSDGAATARFAMLNSKRFAAAAISTCCLEPSSVMFVNGPAFADFAQKTLGFPPLTRPDPDRWAEFSLALGGAKTNTPLLLQLADREVFSGLETFQAMREYRKPIDLFVYPDQYHIKWHPRAKLAVGDRAIDWFAFWLQGKVDPDPAKVAQFAHWQDLRAQRAGPPPSP